MPAHCQHACRVRRLLLRSILGGTASQAAVLGVLQTMTAYYRWPCCQIIICLPKALPAKLTLLEGLCRKWRTALCSP